MEVVEKETEREFRSFSHDKMMLTFKHGSFIDLLPISKKPIIKSE